MIVYPQIADSYSIAPFIVLYCLSIQIIKACVICYFLFNANEEIHQSLKLENNSVKFTTQVRDVMTVFESSIPGVTSLEYIQSSRLLKKLSSYLTLLRTRVSPGAGRDVYSPDSLLADINGPRVLHFQCKDATGESVVVSAIGHRVVWHTTQVNATSRVQHLLEPVAHSALGVFTVQLDAAVAALAFQNYPVPLAVVDSLSGNTNHGRSGAQVVLILHVSNDIKCITPC